MRRLTNHHFNEAIESAEKAANLMAEAEYDTIEFCRKHGPDGWRTSVIIDVLDDLVTMIDDIEA